MNPIEHHSTVDRGLKMKIKRKNVAGSSKSEAPKHEIIQSDSKALNSSLTIATSQGSDNGMGSPSTLDKLKQTLAEKERDRTQGSKLSNSPSLNSQGPISPYRNMNNKRKSGKSDGAISANSGSNSNGSFVSPGSSSSVAMDSGNIGIAAAASGSSNTGNGSILAASSVMVELHRMNNMAGVKKEPTACDPYEFNAKEEDRIGLPIVKKVKAEKMDEPTLPGAAQSEVDMEQRDVGTETSSVGVATDPDCLGPCEPGTSVVLEGIVWNETENGILVVNITWRGKTYVGTLMDATKHAWAPPRFNCDSPAVTSEARPCRGRGKRRAPVTPPVDMGERRLRKRKNNTNPYAAPPSPAKSESNTPKRRGRPADLDLDLDNIRTSKRARKNANAPTPENGFIECPEPNCSKKYRHINGLRYHQAHAHKNDYVDEEMDTEVEEKTPAEETQSKPVVASPSTKSGRGRKATVTSPSEDQSADNQNSSENGASEQKPETVSKPGRKGKKDDKQANLDSKKQLDKQPTVALTQVNMDGKKSVTSPPTTYQTSTVTPLSSCVTTVSVVPSTAGIQSTTTTSTVSTVAMTTVVQSSEKSRKTKGDKEKKGKTAKAIVSSPAQISIAAASLPQNNSGGLKPIQPKPTVLGETSSPNSALAGLKEQRKPKKKKNKDKDKDKESSKDKQRESTHKDLSTIDMSVIQMSSPVEKVAPTTSLTSSVVTGNKSLEALVKMSNPPELQKQAAVQLGSTIEKTNSPPELQKQLPLPKVNSPMKSHEGSSTRPPSSLSLNSPVTNNADNKDSSSTNAQSPAYSDISDANDSNATLEADAAPVKVKVEPNIQKSTSPNQQDQSNSDKPQAPGNFQGAMYGSYYPQGAYHSPSSNHAAQGRDGQKAPSQNTPGKPSDKPRPISEAPVTPKVEKMDDAKAKERMDKEMAQKGSPNPAQMRDYQERMMAAQAQQMAQYHQYMGTYGYGVDMRLLASNPEYKAQYEKWLVEQGRARREMMEQQAKMAKGSEGKPVSQTPHDLTRPLDLNTKAMDLSKQGKGSPSMKPGPMGEGRHSPLDIKQEGFRPRDMMPDGRPKDKPLEGTSHDDSGKDARSRQMSGGSGNPPYDRQEEYHRRYYMYQQQQRMMEHKRHMEQQHQQQQKGDNGNKVGHSSSPMDVKREGEGRKLPKESVGNAPDLQNSYHKGLSHSGSRSNLTDIRSSEQPTKSDKDKSKSAGLSSSPAGAKPKDQYGQYYHHQGYPGYPHPPYDTSHQMYPAQGGGTPHGYNQNSYPPYPPHMRSSFPEGTYKDSGKPGAQRTSSPGAKPTSSTPHPANSGAPEGKALELLQQKAATYYNTHSPHGAPPSSQKLHSAGGKDASKPSDKPIDNPVKDGAENYDSSSLKSAIVAGKDKVEGKDREKLSPPTQRHVHTHHHTHVVGPAHYSLYGPYGALMATQSPPSGNPVNIPYSSPK